jgi:hypothetical protein
LRWRGGDDVMYGGGLGLLSLRREADGLSSLGNTHRGGLVDVDVLRFKF